MNADTKHESPSANDGFERRDLRSVGVIYFLVGLALATVLASLLLTRFYDFLDKRERSRGPAVSPLVTVPADTRHIPRNYPETAFPNPRLEEDERDQLNQVRLKEEQTLNSYGWVDKDKGIVRIPIERAMDLIAQRGLPVRPAAPAETPAKKDGGRKGTK
ncbi:MAG TPA: hypothetical protein VMU61_09480 [Candidatus Aquilonibacter sp.]|nr:hypothetical protein [Candidatus Aquilonibacter sp.]